MLFTLCAYCWAMTLNIYIDTGRLVAVRLAGGVPTPPPKRAAVTFYNKASCSLQEQNIVSLFNRRNQIEVKLYKLYVSVSTNFERRPKSL